MPALPVRREVHRQTFAIGAINATSRSYPAIDQSALAPFGQFNEFEFINASGQTLRLEFNQDTGKYVDVEDGKGASADVEDGIRFQNLAIFNRGASASTADAAATPVQLICKVVREE